MILMEFIVFFAAIFIAFVIYIIRNIYQEGRRRRQFEKTLRTEYGKRRDKTYAEGRMSALKRQLLSKQRQEGFIDDITSDDLELDRLFMRMDRTFSSAGEESLYAMLRNPLMERAQIEDRRSLISWMDDHENERVRLQILYAGIGRTGRYSVFDFTRPLLDMDRASNFRHYAVLALMLVSIALMPVHTGTGLIMFLILLIYNFLTYFRDKKKIEPYISTVGYILRLLKFAGSIADELEGVDASDKGGRLLSEMAGKISKERSVFTGFERMSFLVTGSVAMSSDPLEVVMEYLRMGLHLNLIRFNQMHDMLKEHFGQLQSLIEMTGYIEGCISAAEFVKSLPLTCIPGDKKTSGSVSFEAEGMYHPLVEGCIRNDLSLKGCMLLTGSNASGKSTFLKTVAICQLLYQVTGFTCAKRYDSGIFGIYTSMALRDDLAGGRSYFIVETQSLKRIADASADDKAGVMCFIDEVLRGTNTSERIAASSVILERLADLNALCFAATHDIELTYLLEEKYENYHFEEEIKDKDVCFDYLLKPGRAKSRNAIRLLSVMGFSDDVVGRADNRCDTFLKDGVWK